MHSLHRRCARRARGHGRHRRDPVPGPGAHRVPAIGGHGREELRRRVSEVPVDAVARRREDRRRRARARSRNSDRGRPEPAEYPSDASASAAGAAASCSPVSTRRCAATADQWADSGQRRIQPSTGSAIPLHSVQIVRYQPTAIEQLHAAARHRGCRPSDSRSCSDHEPVRSSSSTAPISVRSAVAPPRIDAR